MNYLTGLIVKAISGFYYIEAADTLYECKARGVFRKRGITPSVGDRAEITVLNEDEKTASLENILPRKNTLIRPPLANLDRLFIVSSLSEPAPNTLIIDKITAVAVEKGIEPIAVFTKSDLADPTELLDIYHQAGITALSYSIHSTQDREVLISLLKDKISAFTGNTGVGKSSLLNSLFPELAIETAAISRKLGRGRHTTRHVELFRMEFGGMVFDTPGFTSFDIPDIQPEELAELYPDLYRYADQCRFKGCLHDQEPECSVQAAVERGDIHTLRYKSYKEQLELLKSNRKY